MPPTPETKFNPRTIKLASNYKLGRPVEPTNVTARLWELYSSYRPVPNARTPIDRILLTTAHSAVALSPSTCRILQLSSDTLLSLIPTQSLPAVIKPDSAYKSNILSERLTTDVSGSHSDSLGLTVFPAYKQLFNGTGTAATTTRKPETLHGRILRVFESIPSSEVGGRPLRTIPMYILGDPSSSDFNYHIDLSDRPLSPPPNLGPILCFVEILPLLKQLRWHFKEFEHTVNIRWPSPGDLIPKITITGMRTLSILSCLPTPKKPS